MLSVLLYFGLGVIADLLITAHYRAISVGRAYAASVLSFMITILSMKVLEQVITTRADVLIVAFAAGSALGTFLCMRLKK